MRKPKLLPKTFRRWLGRLFYAGNPQELFRRGCLSEETVMNVLRSLDKTNGGMIKNNAINQSFVQLVPVLHHYGKALSFLNTYGYVSDVYFAILKRYSPEKNAELQKKFCEIREIKLNADCKHYRLEYPKLFYRFLKAHDFLPEIMEMLSSSEKYQTAIHGCNLYRRKY